MRIPLIQKKIYILFVYVFISLAIIIAMIAKRYTDTDYLTYCGVVVLIHIIVSLICLGKSEKTLFNISGIFLIIAFVLHYGQFVLILFSNYTFYKRNFITRYPVSVYSVALIKCLVITSCITIGMLLSSSRAEKAIEKADARNNEAEKEKCKRIGIVLTVILLPIRIFIDIQRLLISISFGYLSSLHELSINNIFIVFSRLSTVSIVLLLYGLPKRSKSRKIVFLGYALYLIAMMISGSRLSFIISLIILCMCYVRFEEIKISIKSIVIVIIALLLVTSFMATAREYRYYNLGERVSVSSFLEVFRRKLTTENAILQEIEEMGQSFYTCSAAVDHVNHYGYAHGKSYYLGITAVMPNITGLINRLDVMSSYTRTMQRYGITADYVNIGGSAVGEIIYNFEYIFPAFAFFVGLCVAFFSRRFDETIRSDQCDYRLIYSICIMMALLEWSRDTFSASVRYFTWGCLMFWLFNKLYRGKRKSAK